MILNVKFKEAAAHFDAKMKDVTVINNGKDSATFYPFVSDEGIISWTNDCGLENPQPVNIKGDVGKSAYEYAKDGGYTGTESEFAKQMAQEYVTKDDITEMSSHIDSESIHVTSEEKERWNNKSNFSGAYEDLTGRPTIPSKTSQLTNDSNFLTEHQDISGKQDKTDNGLATNDKTVIGAINEVHEKTSELQEDIEAKIETPLTAELGQTIIVEEVDENGKPIKWKCSDALSQLSEEIVNETESRKNAIKELSKQKADVIVDSASGNNIVVTDSANENLRGMKLFGKSEQNEIKGNQLLPYPFVDTTKTVNGVTYVDEGDGWVSISGTSTDKSTFLLLIDGVLSVNDGDEITVSKETIGSLDDVVISGWAYNWEKFFEDRSLAVTKNTHQTGKITSNKIKIQLTIDAVGATFNGKIRVMVNKGSTALPYEPYTENAISPSPEYPQEIRSVGGDGSVKVEVYGKNLHPDGLARIDRGNDSGAIIPHLDLNVHASLPTNFPVPIGETLTLSHNHIFSDASGVVKLMQYDKNGVFISRHEASVKSNKITFTPHSSCKYMSVVIYDSDGVELDGLKIQLEVGMKETSYEPYNKQSMVVPTPNGLPGIPVRMETEANYVDANGKYYACDYIDFERGKYIQRIGKMVLDGSVVLGFNNGGTWHISSKTIKDKLGIEYLAGNVENGYYVLSNRFLLQILSYNCDNTYKNSMYWQPAGSTVSVNGAHLFETQDDNGFKKFFAEHPTIIYCVLNNPIETDLTEEQIAQYKALTMNYPTTTLLSDAPIQVDYVADTKKYIDKKFAELAKALI